MKRYEQPDYRVVAQFDEYEVREYDSYLAAETTVSGDFDSTGGAAFRLLAGFIFGRNSEGAKMNMTVPVTRERVDDDRYRYRFVMERAYTEDNLPSPVDDDVEIARVPAGIYAVRRYRGRPNEARFRRAERALFDALKRDGMEMAGTSVSAVYNGPFTPAAMRHNEVLVPVVWAEPDARSETLPANSS